MIIKMKRYEARPVTAEQITLRDGFWSKRQETVSSVTIDAVYDRFKETGRFEALKCNWKEGEANKPHIFWESDVTKWIEGAAYFIQKERNEALEEKIDELVECMEANQDADGYLNTYFTVVEPEARFTRRTDHELYCAGHLIEGALAYVKATGKDKMLKVAIRYTDLIDRVFRIEHAAAFDTPGHEEIELALFKLYDYTGEERYKLLAEYFIDTRGRSERDETYDFTDQEHMQSHRPVREQKTAEGHSVRALYLYAGMADMARLNQEDALFETCQELFENITEKRMYITGGVGSTYRGESFTYDYDLPEYTAYNETCASIALALFCRRMWLIEADGSYADCAERALYNTVLSGMSLSGDKFFYENPIAADPRRNAFNDSRPDGLKEHLPILERVKVFDCSCCPPNLIRTIGSIADYMYSTTEHTIFAHCYMSAEAKLMLGEKEVILEQQTNYPYDGEVVLDVKTAGSYTIALRIPAWCDQYQLMVNGQQTKGSCRKGYLYLTQEWQEMDRIVLKLSMTVMLMEGNRNVADICGKVAAVRGPLVFSAEGMDHGDVPLRDIRLDRKQKFDIKMEQIEGVTVPVLYGEGFIRKQSETLYSQAEEELIRIPVRLIPYFTWANRKVTEMTTWFLKK